MSVDDCLFFPAGFLWGTATAAHQVEGGNENNDWWVWEQMPGRVRDGGRSGLAADWWHRAEEDLARAAQWGQNSHRLSLEWSRLEPRPGAWDEDVAARYRRMLGTMRALGLTPMITLHHFTLPLWAYERGGWQHPEMASWFIRFVSRVVETFGEHCQLWCTLNEPLVQIAYGYVLGIWPPGNRGLLAARRALLHMRDAHIGAYETIHQRQPHAQVGIAKHIHLFEEANPRSVLDRLGAAFLDHLFNESGLAALVDGELLLPIGLMRRPTRQARWADFIGVNYYWRSRVRFDTMHARAVFLGELPMPGASPSMNGWGMLCPEGLYYALKRVALWGKPIYITEFGVLDNGVVDEEPRSRAILEHVAAIYRAIREGVDVRGAYYWSLVDCFEWAEGWSVRFGLMHLDPDNQERRLKPGSRVYERVARANGLERSLVSELAPEMVMVLFDGNRASDVEERRVVRFDAP
ncbi:MAG: glycoside hydrolase family 1 protein [Chloroflexi bacterium]|nr:glycoside hydrolase family 1 protein [Chloroflexota bacterium]